MIVKYNIPLPDFVKLDTQGSELDILKGAPKELFNKANYIYTECPLVEYNEKAPDIKEYLKTMDELGYYPCDICETHSHGSVLFISKRISSTT